jgi:glycosyltransferase involved in cell wall biosynthesis
MKIIYICPGTGGAFYCENCVRDNAMVSGLRALGHDVDIVPMYLPVNVEDTSQANGGAVMFGAVRLYLIDKFPSLKKLPQKILRLLDNRAILNMAAGFAGSTRAGGHEEMTISMIMGEEGVFADEFEVTADYLIAQKPDLIFIPNAFLLGIASAVKAKTSSIKVVCMLQDEHVWVDSSAAAYRNKTWEAVSKKSRSADMLCAHSNWYREKIAKQINISPDMISTVPLGVDPKKYVNSSLMTTASAPPKISIGYISRLCRDMGMDVLAEAYCRLLRSGVCGGGSSVIEFCGGYTKDDVAVVNQSRKKISKAGGRINIRKRFDISSRINLLSSLSVLSVPTQISIAFGGFITEAMAMGVPVVQPDEGGFSEVVAETGAGLLYSPNTPEALAEALERVIRDDECRKSMAEAGIKAVAGKYNNVEMARKALGGLN